MWARSWLIERVQQRAYEYGITPDGVAAVERTLTEEENRQRERLMEEIGHKGYHPVMEETACLWFMRLVSLRFMEANGFLSSGARVFTDEQGAFRPQVLKEAITMGLSGQDQEKLYRSLLIARCNGLHEGLPRMFEERSDWTELLFPDRLLDEDGVLGRMVAVIGEKDWCRGVRIIGWLYQHYNSKCKDETFAALKKNVKISKERLPAATQLFTPDWIVRYLVENSLGRIYIRYALGIQGQRLSGAQRGAAEQEIADQMGWHYFIPEAEQPPEVPGSCGLQLTDLKIIDPCMGSGHILVYAFDVLMQIYKAQGWSEPDAARSIIEHNLYGLDIDDRAGQLSDFAVMMKAGSYHRGILNGETKPHVYAIADSGFMTDQWINGVAEGDAAVKAQLVLLRDVFQDAKEYGSLLSVPQMDFNALYDRIDRQSMAQPLLPLIRQAEIMARPYDVVVTNPPYMSVGNMSPKLAGFVRKNYPDSKADLFAVFMERCAGMVKPQGYQAMVTQHSWMFLRSFEKLRRKLLAYDMVNLIHLGPKAFEEIPGDVVQTAGFVWRNTHTDGYRGTYCRLTAPASQRGKEELFLSGEGRFNIAQGSFSKIPGAPFAYWLSPAFLELFANNPNVGTVAASKQGIATADNRRYLRLWHECAADHIFFHCESHDRSAADERIWYPYNKGGEPRKWYGNHEYVINWYRDGQALWADPRAAIRNPGYFFQRSVSWSLISAAGPAFRLQPEGQLFDVAGMSCFSEDVLIYLLALFNSKVACEMLKVLAPTINYQCGDIAGIPMKMDPEKKQTVEELAMRNVALSKQDWDAFETSWEFQKHPLV